MSGEIKKAENSSEQAKNVCTEQKSAIMRPEEKARLAKLEAIERQLHYLIGQVRSLKTT